MTAIVKCRLKDRAMLSYNSTKVSNQTNWLKICVHIA